MIRFKFWLFLSLSSVAAGALGLSLLAQPPEPNSPKIALSAKPEPIYTSDPNDAWNRIFYFLFSRRIEARLSDDFPEGAPFSEKPLRESDVLPKVHVSTRVFERTETGDRAIDPLYPSFLSSTGSELILADPAYAQFVQALQDALNESAPRPTIARAFMQSDLWAAHDLFSLNFTLPEEKGLEQRRLRVVDLLSLLIKKIALTPDEIKSLPDNYAAAVQNHSLPDVFRKDSGWVEVQWLPRSMHEEAAGYRRVSRIFVKPAHPPQNLQKFLNALPDFDTLPDSHDPRVALDGAALVTRLLLIDAQGKLQPTTLTTEIQARLFEKTNAGVFKRTTLQVAEISRKLLLREPGSGGLVPEDEAAPIYVSSAGNNYGFASTQLDSEAVQVKLRTRCTFCHGNNDLTFLMSFSIARPPHFRMPPIRQLDVGGRDAADFVIAKKSKQKDFEALRAYFGGARPAGAIHWKVSAFGWTEDHEHDQFFLNGMKPVLRSGFHEDHGSTNHEPVFWRLIVARDLHARPSPDHIVNFVLVMGRLLVSSLFRKQVDSRAECRHAQEFQVALAAGSALGLQLGDAEESLHALKPTLRIRPRK